MLDFNKKVHNSDKFRQAAIKFQTDGRYCDHPKASKEYLEYWEEEEDRCLNGYTAGDGDFITGFNYFYLNFCPIKRVVEKAITQKDGTVKHLGKSTIDFPSFYIHDCHFFDYVDDAYKAQKHGAVLKARRRGYSYKAASMLLRNYFLVPNSKGYVFASQKRFLVGDGTLTKAWSMMSFIDEHTAFSKKRQVKDGDMHKRASVLIKDALGNKIETGYMSEIMGFTLHSDPDKLRGIEGQLMFFEEGGCHLAGTEVLMADGSIKKVEDIKLGDLLMGPDGTSRKVLELHTGEDDMYDIIPTKGEIQTVNSKHLVYGRKRDYYRGTYDEFTLTPLELLEIQEKTPRMMSQYDILRTDQIKFPHRDVKIDPYYLGLWLGDGSKDNTCISNQDPEVFEFLENYAKQLGLVYRKQILKQSKTCFNIHLSSGTPGKRNVLLNLLRDYNLIDNKHIPEDYIYNDREIQLQLLAGFIDSGGSYNPKKHEIEITQSGENHKDLIYKLKFIADSLGMRTKLTTRISRERVMNNNKIKGGNTIYRLMILQGHEQIPTKIARKQTTDRQGFIRNSLASRFKIKYHGVDNYYGFTVDKDNLFVLSDFSIVHNSFSELMSAWNVARAAVEQDTYLVGMCIAFGTASVDNEDFSSLEELFTKPEAHNVYGINNIWDEGMEDQKVGFFHPFYEGLEGYDEEGNRLYMDADGNTFKEKAMAFIQSERQKVITHATSQRNIDAYCMERAITPRDAMLTLTGNIFPIRAAQDQLVKIRTNKSLQNHKQVGELVFDNTGVLVWKQKKGGDITKFPLDTKDDPKGAIVIWEHPVQHAPFSLYVASLDPYDHDQAATSDSLGSCFVYKRFNTLEDYNDVIVAEYTGRPDTAEEYYENVRKLMLYYNSKLLYENQNKGLFTHFINKKSDYLLVDQPDILSDIIKNSKVNRRKGVHMTRGIKSTAVIWLRDWLVEEYAPGQTNINKIFSEPLLEEIIKYNDKGNYDRISSLLVLMILLKEYQRITVKNIEKEERRKLFLEPLFTADYFNDGYATTSLFEGL